ncbi:putative ras-family member GTP-binding protein [Leptomonas pyrrhocoris]|uniref:Putative ras-family member GTP-binding protein n=1 Tax=Leptomonas pyrrhocoris TaxID=157538 RepID=A0A0N0DSS2_LEPPY|nr:putative ras-family member GTP-binding protein [Leptomonas pyrrhocoris]XP_015654787.1 putative ras-family member GTP-binding protein [Leptomonas pyrrhocoris]XP_015654788.1 putative ras-family member GTP-binding protein [Leptomonas pyrrhocoris]KPA76347.1 putative ras-family member GTP-binding protein [Leptomonas pyrrhocoris]KPA76348.1 putative ras-family member GTP-binding protein [Leptomonas pyrrhocoris]KPA76349.1 putative ras-family member GTP-binding protein [Leptomonas pyrrhocoris]|eukprot:XP_015654786.1 putative ras-family member GTP-binding protein [Leptomonas pyrrhocoris]
MDQKQMQKLLLMGPGGAGKTCMRSIIFDNYLPRDALRLGITISLDQSQVHILRNLFLNLWDCGGQHRYVSEYLSRQKEYIFRYVGVMLFVFDINSMSRDSYGASGVGSSSIGGGGEGGSATTDWKLPEMLNYFKEAMRYIRQYSPKAKVFVLLHKIDLIHRDMRQEIFEARKQEIMNCIDPEDGADIDFFGTSIWSDSLYLAYSSVVRSLVPHRDVLVETMRGIAVACDAVEVALYERSTFLCLTHVTRTAAKDAAAAPPFLQGNGELRTTEVSETVKHFKLSCMNNTTSLGGLSIATESFTAMLYPFTECTHVLVVSADPQVSVELHKLNVNAARRRFQQFLDSDEPTACAMREVL